tara:strand:- start:777 stop:998 length:222 start_codon:yes stop_codon:yes gene_type:complete
MEEEEYPLVLSYVHPTKKIAIVKIMRNEAVADEVFNEFEHEFGYAVPYSIDHIDALYSETETRRAIGFQSRSK